MCCCFFFLCRSNKPRVYLQFCSSIRLFIEIILNGMKERVRERILDDIAHQKKKLPPSRSLQIQIDRARDRSIFFRFGVIVLCLCVCFFFLSFNRSFIAECRNIFSVQNNNNTYAINHIFNYIIHRLQLQSIMQANKCRSTYTLKRSREEKKILFKNQHSLAVFPFEMNGIVFEANVFVFFYIRYCSIFLWQFVDRAHGI